MEIKRGLRDKLEKYINVDNHISVSMKTVGKAEYDYCCFGVDANGKLSDDRYMVFYNQPQTPKNEIAYSAKNGEANFDIQLNLIPSSIVKLVFTVSIDGNGTMGEISSFRFALNQPGKDGCSMTLSGKDFHSEKAIITVELYKKDVWRFAAIASGFNGGLSDLLKEYGGEEVTTQPVPQKTVAQNARVSLEKKLEKDAPKLVSLAKPLAIELEKRNLQDCIAKVALVLDISGSMSGRYRDGTVQEIVNKTLPLAVQFDDDGELDFWYYGSRPKRMPSVNMRNYQTAIPNNWESLMRSLGYGNTEPLVMKEVLKEYSKSSIPAYVIFITDGGVGSESEIKKVLIEASKEPIFWQFVGVGGSGYGVLERLDNMTGRYVDNANFFALDDFKTVTNPELYSRLLNEFPQWLQEIKRKRMI